MLLTFDVNNIEMLLMKCFLMKCYRHHSDQPEANRGRSVGLMGSQDVAPDWLPA